jgi:hypothetical protein
LVPARLDLNHVGTPEQQLGVTLGSVLIYLRSGGTARAVADGWTAAAVLARSLGVAVAGRRPLLVGPTTVAAMIRFAGLPRVSAAFEPARGGGAVPAVLRIVTGPVRWEVTDATGLYLDVAGVPSGGPAAWSNPTEDDE